MLLRYGIDPTSWLLVMTQIQIEHCKAVYNKDSLRMKREMLKHPESRPYIPVDKHGEPIWDEKINGQYTVLVVKINKGDGLTEYGEIR
jgi:hypothetical protein